MRLLVESTFGIPLRRALCGSKTQVSSIQPASMPSIYGMTDKDMTGSFCINCHCCVLGVGAIEVSFMDLDLFPISFVRYRWICIARELCAGLLSFARVR